MGKQDDKIQQMIDDGLIFGSNDYEPPNADDPLVQELMQRMDECDEAGCNQTGPHVHLVMKRPEGLDMSEEDLQALMQRKFNEQVQKAIREREQAAKKRELGLG